MAKLKIRLLLLLLITVVLLQGCAGSEQEEWGVLSVSWIRDFSIEELAPEAELVVVGEITGIAKEYQLQTTGEAPENVKTPPKTDFTFNVTQVLKGECAEEIIVSQTGGYEDGQLVEIKDYPLFRVGERYVLFLKGGDNNQLYSTLGPWGRFLMEGDRVYTLRHKYPDVPVAGDVNGLSLKEFITVTGL